MNIPQIARAIDLFALAFVFGATTWFFFVQSPVLLKRLGREKFVPIQMQLTVVLFRALSVVLLIILGASAGHSPFGSATTLAAGIALVAGLINQFVVVPRALKAGGRVVGTSKAKTARDQPLALHRRVQVFGPSGYTGSWCCSW